MNKILVVNPAIASANLGDYIIEEVIKEYIHEWFPNSFVIDIPSHTPINNLYFYSLKDPTYTLVTGTNLLQNYPIPIDRQWDIKMGDLTRLNKVVLFGPGWRSYKYRPHLLTPFFYKKLLHPTLLQSVRDGHTKEIMDNMGIKNVINTSCPTTWMFTEEFNQTIPAHKASRVVTTITGYAKDVAKDKLMLDTLVKNYDTVYLWCQGYHDLKYYMDKLFDERIVVLPNTLQSYKDILKEDDLDYVGTRLHGGIYAMRHQKRSLIITVDNRAREINRDINLPTLERQELHMLEDFIHRDRPTNIILPQEEINRFISQFKK